MFCSHCGSRIDDKACICIHCGCRVTPNVQNTVPAEDDAPSSGYAILGFFIPLVGLILYLVHERTHPQKARSAGKGALIGFIVSIALSIVSAIASYALTFLAMSEFTNLFSAMMVNMT